MKDIPDGPFPASTPLRARRPARILVMVPNGATRDQRVVREAHSLRNAGHDVLLAGLRLNTASGSAAITDQGMPVERIDWQYRAYLRLALIYAAVVLPLLAGMAMAMVFAVSWLVSSVIVPLAGQGAALLQPGLSAGAGSLPGLGPAIPAVLAVLVLGAAALALRVGWRMLRRVRARHLASMVPFLPQLIRRFSSTRSYGEREGVRGTSMVERLVSIGDTSLFCLPEVLARRVVQDARTRGFVALGRRFRPDIVHCHEIGTLEAGATLKAELGCRLVYEAHEIYDDLANASSAMSADHRRVHAAHLDRVDGFVTVNELIADYYAQTYPAMPAPVVMPNSVFPSQAVDDGRLREAAKLPEDARILLYQGGFSPNRGLELLMEAAYQMPEGWFTVFMGWGSLQPELEARRDALTAEALQRAQRRLIADAMTEGERPERLQGVVSGGVPDSPSQRVTAEEMLVARLIDAHQTEADGMPVVDALRSLRRAELDLWAEERIRAEISAIRRNGLLERVRFVDAAPHAELPQWTAGATVGVVPYLNIGLNHWMCSPNKLWEYPNAGVPLLTTRLAYLHRMIAQHGIGWTIPSDPTPADLVAAVRAISDADLAQKREACRSFIECSNYTLHEPLIVDLFDRLGSPHRAKTLEVQ